MLNFTGNTFWPLGAFRSVIVGP